jgi:hypothetical protein
MSRQDFVNRYKHELAGFVVDAIATPRQGPELSLWLRSMMARIDAKLGAIYDEFNQPQQPPANGKPAAGLPQPRK